MNKDQKAAVVEELSEQIRSAEAIFAVDYRGISVSDAAELRHRLREAQTRFRIVKNSLTERASDQAGAEALKAMLEGPTALAFVSGDAALAAKALNDAARSFGTLQFKGGLMDGDTLTAEQIQSIARLPSRDVLHGQLVGTIAAPLSGLVRTLNALIAGIAIQLQQMAEQGLVTGEAPAVEEPAPQPEAEAAPEPEAEAAPETESASAEAPEAEATPEPAAEEPAEEAPAAEAPAETAEEPAETAEPEAETPPEPESASAEAPEAEATPEEPAAEEPGESETSEETDTEASDAEASEE
ncbi:MAG TPA: 50S ribosomal protein L10 [Solirubrobacteraceae bacterium]|nr:50S ribosomal protein L10 [Solirubrobacteraceae bacterium]